MPWIREADCVRCGSCVAICPVNAVCMTHDAVFIDDRICIRCGRCHDICPQEAVRHDSERIPLDVEANLVWTRDMLRHFDTLEERRGLVERMRRYFVKQRKVAEQTIEKLATLEREL
ncbi:MAG: 4Fe-4S binding protein [Phycisphaerae bacterium]|nr:4Fe-4S binding protein [Phycisphaerae bacterium]